MCSHEALVSSLDSARARIRELEAERDALLTDLRLVADQCNAARDERDLAHDEYCACEAECDALRGAVEAADHVITAWGAVDTAFHIAEGGQFAECQHELQTALDAYYALLAAARIEAGEEGQG